MGLVQNNFDGGTDTTAITTANSGGTSGDAFSIATSPTDQIIQYDHTTVSGQKGARFATRATAARSVVGWRDAAFGTWTTVFYGRTYFLFSELPTVNTGIIWHNAPDDLAGARVQILGASDVINAINAGGVGMFTGTTVISAGTLYRIEYEYTPSATVGRLKARLYEGHSTTLLESELDSGASHDTKASIDLVRFGTTINAANQPTSTGYVYHDNVMSGASDWPGPAAPPATPVIRADYSRFPKFKLQSPY